MLDFVTQERDLTEMETRVRDIARKFLDDKVRADNGDYLINGMFRADLIEKIGELGFYSSNLDGYGPPGLSERAYGVLMQELEAWDSGLRSMPSVQGALVMYPIYAFER